MLKREDWRENLSISMSWTWRDSPIFRCNVYTCSPCFEVWAFCIMLDLNLVRLCMNACLCTHFLVLVLERNFDCCIFWHVLYGAKIIERYEFLKLSLNLGPSNHIIFSFISSCVVLELCSCSCVRTFSLIVINKILQLLFWHCAFSASGGFLPVFLEAGFKKLRKRSQLWRYLICILPTSLTST